MLVCTFLRKKQENKNKHVMNNGAAAFKNEFFTFFVRVFVMVSFLAGNKGK